MTFSPPDFSEPRFADFPDARFAPAPADGVLPDGFFSTTNLPTFVRMNGRWRRAARAAHGLGDSCTTATASSGCAKGGGSRRATWSPSATRKTARDGIFVQTQLVPHGADPDAFTFMSSEVSREKPIDYAHMARLLIEEKERGGYPIWVTGPALVHSRARADMSWFIANGFVGALLAGNAVAVHDIEASIYGTTLGMTNTGEITQGGHGLHMRAINQVRAAGSIANGGRAGDHHRRHHVRVREAQDPVRAHRLDSRRRPAARRDHRRARGAGRDARARDQGDDGDPHRHGAARDRDGQHASGVRRDSPTARCASCRRSASTRRSSS